MNHINRISCYLMGEESLLAQCAAHLLEQGHTIQGIITTAPRNKEWAANHNVPVINAPLKSLADALTQPFDYFFSITNLKIIPDAVINKAAKGAINFHDGPLPNYAGLYATTWALLNQENSHGITWHTMTAGIDEGDILKQQIFDIVPGETAFTLNTKCYEAAMETFPQLIDELASGTVQRRPQNPADLTYFGKTKRPTSAAILDFTQTANKLAALVKSLDFGRYENPVTLPKLRTTNKVVAVPEIEVLDRTSTQPAGTITAVSPLTITTATNDVVLPTLRKFNGKPITAAELDLTVGQALPRYDDDTQTALTELHQTIAKHDAFWHKRLATVSTPDLPYASQSATERNQFARAPFASDHSTVQLTAAFAAYISRLTGNGRFDLGYVSQSLTQTVGDFYHLFSPIVPLRLIIDDAQPMRETMATLTAAIDKTNQKQTFAWDSFSRFPNLTDMPRLPIMVVETDDVAGFRPFPHTELALLLDSDGQVEWLYDTAVYTPDSITQMQRQFSTFLQYLASDDSRTLGDTLLLSDAEMQQMLVEWNATEVDYDRTACIHHLFETQAERTPEKTAIHFRNQSLTYAELNQRANQLARQLVQLGVGPDVIVGVYMDRCLELIVSLIAIHKAGGAYLPLDPEYPADRIAFMVEDAATPVLLTRGKHEETLPPHQAHVLRVDTDWPTVAQNNDANLDLSSVTADHLAYVIYTSGSTGKPKGVMVQHGNAVNFFVGMDDRIPHDPAGTWLAVTSLSFDISVLEIFWTLTRGFEVVLYANENKAGSEEVAISSPHAERPIGFSLFYFASDESEQGVDNKYKLLLEGAKFADAHGFESVWTPERHFHAFGGLYPNPSVTGAAVAAITKNVGIRAGSCVLPLHNPIRVAEEWSIVDNISGGRVGLSIAAGWQPNDFVLRPESYADRKNVMFHDIETVKKLWRGGKETFAGPNGDVEVSILPKPVQKELPIWVTAAGNPETFRMAGEGGFNILTHLLGQGIEELNEKLAVYRQAWKDAGHEGEGHVTLMLHTFVGDDMEEVRETVRQPMTDYLKSSVFLIKQAAWHFPTFKQKAEETGQTPADMFESEDLSDEEMDALLAFAFDRYFENSGLFGTPQHCLNQVNKLKGIGVDEIACQIDFGVPSDKVLRHLDKLAQLLEMAKPENAAADYSIPALIKRHGVTHFQCTPSMASMLLVDEATEAALANVDVMMVGGEAFPDALAERLHGLVKERVINMYGPTETTIWSSTYQLAGGETAVSIGTPIANTQIYILDKHGYPAPAGVAGELLIGGDGVVRGYHNRPELTAERFIQNPFIENGRVYRTGDLARYRADGQIDFLGRLDFQVKIRGYRIELGEIESLLNQHESVKDAVVVAREDTPGDKRLVAYLIPHKGQAIAAAALRDHLRADLPDFMVPAHFVEMERFPLTPNKKTDRKALPAPDKVVVKSEVAFVAPTNDLEQQIAAIWQELLGVPKVGLNDNFFDLGGHSLLTVQAHRRIKGLVEKPIAVTDMFRFPTIRSLTDFLSQSNGTNGNGKNGTNGAGGRTAVSHGQDRAAARREARANRIQRRQRIR